jgi:hypothetical protein
MLPRRRIRSDGRRCSRAALKRPSAATPPPPANPNHSLPPLLSPHPWRQRARGTAVSGAEHLAGPKGGSGTVRASLAGAVCRRCGRAAPSSVARRCPKGTSPTARGSAGAATASFRSAGRRREGVALVGPGLARPLGTKSRARARHQ